MKKAPDIARPAVLKLLAGELTFLSSKLTFLSSKLTFAQFRCTPSKLAVHPWVASVTQG